MSDEKIKTGGKVKYDPIYDIDSDDTYDVDQVLKKELQEQNLEFRWIDFKRARLNGGRSLGGWIIYKRRSEDPRMQGISALADPDGLVRNGSMVLAVKTKANAEKQRRRRDQLSKSFSDYNKLLADELSQDAKRLGGSTKVLAGYDKNR